MMQSLPPPPTPAGTVIRFEASIRADNAPMVVAGVSVIVTKTWGQGHCYRRVGGGIDALMNGLMVERDTAGGGVVRGIQMVDGGLFADGTDGTGNRTDGTE